VDLSVNKKMNKILIYSYIIPRNKMDLIHYCREISNGWDDPCLEKLKYFTDYCDINKEVNGKTALSYLVKTDHVLIVKGMIEQGADPTRGNLLLESCNIMCALDEYDLDEIQERIDELGAEDCIPDEYIRGFQNKNMYKFLLDLGLDVNDTQEDMTPLESVCLEGNLDKIELLLRKDVNLKDITYICKAKVHETMERERKKWLAVLLSSKTSTNELHQLSHLTHMHDKTLAQMLLPFL
jgi:ankyrin repeat protein